MLNHRLFSVAIMLAAATLAGCSSQKGPTPPTFSPNGQPLPPPQWPSECPDALDAWFDTLDTSHSGKLTQAQLLADAEAQFKLMDLRHDGKVTAEELSKYRLAAMGGHYLSVSTPGERSMYGLGGHDNDEDRPGDRIGGGYGNGDGDDDNPRHKRDADRKRVDAFSALVTDQPDPVMTADTDMDGSVTWDEFRALVTQNFADFDKDHAGYITKSEIEKTCTGGRKGWF
jgi:hypothetical protein